jgi:lysophospholipase L1-like esterase
MSDYPDSIYDGRDRENKEGFVTDLSDATRLFKEDAEAWDGEITAIQESLGVEPGAPGEGKFLRLNNRNAPLQERLRHLGSHHLDYKNFTEYNSDLVPASAYPGIITEGGEPVGTGVFPSISFLTGTHDYIIRQTGLVYGFRFFPRAGAWDNVGEFKLQIHRNISGTIFKSVVLSEDVLDQVVPGEINTITFDTPIEVRSGDYIGGYITHLGFDVDLQFEAAEVEAGVVWARPGPVDGVVDWSTSLFTGVDLAIPIEVIMTAPQIVVLGESIQDGFIDSLIGNYSFIDNRDRTNSPSSLSYLIEQCLDNTVQNYCFGGSTFLSPSPFGNSIRDRWDEVVALKPKTVVLGTPINDLIAENLLADVLTAYTEILDEAQTEGIFLICLSIAPSTGSSDTEADSIDTWNTAISDLVKSYKGTVYVDVKDRIGAFRESGEAGNLQDIKAEFDEDGLHLNQIGYQAYGDFVLEHVGAVILKGFAKYKQIGFMNGCTNSRSGRIAELCSGENIGYFGGRGGVIFYANNMFLNKDGDFEVRGEGGPGAVKASGMAITNGRFGFYSGEAFTDGQVLTPAELAPFLAVGLSKDRVNVYKDDETVFHAGNAEFSGPSSTILRVLDQLTIFGDNIRYKDGTFYAGAEDYSYLALSAGAIAFYSRTGATPGGATTAVLRFLINSAGQVQIPDFTVKGLVETEADGSLSSGAKAVKHIFSATDVETKTGTGTTTLHTFNLPSMFWSVGKSVKMIASGLISSDATPGNTTFRFRHGSTTLCSTAAQALGPNYSNRGWEATCTITCTAVTSTTATLEVQGQLRLSVSAPDAVILDMENTATVSVTRNSAQALFSDINFDNSGNSVTERIFVVEAYDPV